MSVEHKFKLPWPKWGPRKYRDNNDALAEHANATTPKAGFGIEVTEEDDGVFISLSEDAAAGAGLTGEDGGGSGGTSIDLYGARNGAPAVFHLLQSSAPTAP